MPWRIKFCREKKILPWRIKIRREKFKFCREEFRFCREKCKFCREEFKFYGGPQLSRQNKIAYGKIKLLTAK